MNPEDILPPTSPATPEQPVPSNPPAPPEPANPPDPNTRVADISPVNEPGERMVFTVKRHPIGILGVYVTCGLVLIVTAVLAFIMAPSIFKSGNTSQAILAEAVVFAIVAALCAGFALVVTKVYWGNRWTLTSDSITQVNQTSLFKRQSSQLELGDMEDVTAEQNGMLAHMFNYGVLRVETAGESSKFVFTFCPNPNYYAQQILAAREAYEQNRRIET
jgi:uncharacterized membrane protein YdbT with pleckstrin-like domain